MGSLPADCLDDLLFEMYKEVLKHLRSKMNPNMLRTLERLKVGDASTSDLGLCKLRLESFLASMVAREDVHTAEVSDLFLCGLNSRMESMFGAVLSKEVISGIVGVCALHCSKMPSMQEEIEKLVIDLLKFLAESSCIKMNASKLLTPPLKRKDLVIINSPAAPAKRIAKRGNPIEEPHNVNARVLFPEVEDIIDGPSKTTKECVKDDGGVFFLKEVSLNDKLNILCKGTSEMYNKMNMVKSKVDGGATKVRTARSPSMSVVSEDRLRVDGVSVSIPESAKFPLTAREKMVYNAVCSLAYGKLARSTVVNIGGCIVRYFSLGESMAPGNEVCTYIVNALCRKHFLDVRPTVSLKHYFFSSIADVFLSESNDYSYVEKSFNGAASVLPLPICALIFFPVLFANHWFLFVVDLKRELFMFLDSYHSKDEDFSVYTREKLIGGFCRAWGMFVSPNTRFTQFCAAYPRVPKQENNFDCGIFLIKFMELYGSGCKLVDLFSQQDIPSIRVQIVNKLVFSKHNTADINAVKDLIAQDGARV